MKRPSKILPLIGAMMLSSVIFFSNIAYAIEDAILAIVNKDIITEKDLTEYLNAVYFRLKSEGRSDNEINQVMKNYQTEGINRLIEDKLLLGEANKKGVIIRDKAVDDQINTIKKHYPSEKDFEKSLFSEGLTIADIKNRIRDELKSKFLVEDQVRSKIFVNPQEVTEYYEQNVEQFKKPESVELESIFMAYGKDKDAAKGKIADILNLLKNQGNFTDIAKQYSQSPSVGRVAKGQMLPAIENTVFNLAEGEISKPVETDTGIYIFKLVKKYAPETASLEEIKRNIYNYLFQEKFRARYREWIEKIKSKAYVEIKQ